VAWGGWLALALFRAVLGVWHYACNGSLSPADPILLAVTAALGIALLALSMCAR
jgi:hypothetical protein